MRGLVDRGPLLADEALHAQLVDRLGYREDADAQARAGQGAKLIDSRVYPSAPARPHERGARIALIYGVGGVSRGKSDDDPFGGRTEMGAETVAEALRHPRCVPDTRSRWPPCKRPFSLAFAYDFTYKVAGKEPLATATPDIDFAALVRELRKVRGLTQEEFARALDVTVGTMNGWENGRHRPVRAQRKRLLRLAKESRIEPPVSGAARGGGAS